MLTRFLFVNSIVDLLTKNEILTFAFNQPRFRSNTTWNSEATTFANESFGGTGACSIFITINNSIYIPDTKTGDRNEYKSFSISILDENRNEIPFETNSNPIEFFIPRDPNLRIPPMILTNDTFHFVNLTTDLPISIHFEIKANFSYRFVYKFDKQSTFTNSIEVNQSYFTFMLDNQQTMGHRTLIFGLEGENQEYEYRVYSSGCYYLNKENEWKGDGLRVGPKTNLSQTHCYLT